MFENAFCECVQIFTSNLLTGGASDCLHAPFEFVQLFNPQVACRWVPIRCLGMISLSRTDRTGRRCMLARWIHQFLKERLELTRAHCSSLLEGEARRWVFTASLVCGYVVILVRLERRSEIWGWDDRKAGKRSTVVSVKADGLLHVFVESRPALETRFTVPAVLEKIRYEWAFDRHEGSLVMGTFHVVENWVRHQAGRSAVTLPVGQSIDSVTWSRVKEPCCRKPQLNQHSSDLMDTVRCLLSLSLLL